MTIDSALKIRICSALIFGAIVLGAVYRGGGVFELLLMIMMTIGIYEWGKMVIVDQRYRLPLMLFGIYYISLSTGVMIWLRVDSAHGLYNMLTLLLIVWASDVSAYFSGRAIGGPKLAPAISPNKTWAGFIGSSIGAGIVAAVLACLTLPAKFHLATVGHLSPLKYAEMGFVLAMFGQVGDLFISIFKRHYGVKDTGSIMPGHGGVLDRIDALLLVALVFGIIVMSLE